MYRLSSCVAGKEPKNIHGNAIKSTFNWYRQKRRFTTLARNFLHGAIDTGVAPMLNVFLHAMPIISTSNFHIRFDITKVASRWVIRDMQREHRVVEKQESPTARQENAHGVCQASTNGKEGLVHQDNTNQ